MIFLEQKTKCLQDGLKMNNNGDMQYPVSRINDDTRARNAHINIKNNESVQHHPQKEFQVEDWNVRECFW